MKSITRKEAVEFMSPRHYAGRTPSISYSFGWYQSGKLVAVCTFGKPASNNLCEGVCGKDYSPDVYELNRLVADGADGALSSFVSFCLKQLTNKIIVSYADTGMGHTGTIYRACNFLYTGATKQRTDQYTEGNKHSRHYKGEDAHLRKVRTAKHRYIFFCGSKRFKKRMKKKLAYDVVPAPTETSSRYTLGETQKTKILNRLTGEYYNV